MIRTLRWALILFVSTSASYGMDLEITTQADNLYWDTHRKDTLAGHTFDGTDWFWNVEGSITQELSDSLLFKGGVKIDPVLRWRAYSQLGFSLDNLTLRFAPFLGVFNSAQKWFNPGLDTMVEYSWPGLMFVRGGFLTTFAPVSKSGDYYLSSQSAAMGFLMENGIVTFSIEDKAATFRQSEVLSTVDASTKYWLDTEMFLKNFPLRWAILTGYQVTNRSYLSTVEVSTSVHSALLGARFSWDFGAGTVLFLQGESALFSIGWDDTTWGLPDSTAIVQLVAGARYHW